MAAIVGSWGGCSVVDDRGDDNPQGSTGDTPSELPDNDLCLAALQELSCALPFAPQLLADHGSGEYLNVDDPANSTTIGGGFLFTNDASADYLVMGRQDFGSCSVGCVMPADHPCNVAGSAICTDGSACLLCGVSANVAPVCTDLLSTCRSPDGGGGGGADGGSSDSGGAADETGESANGAEHEGSVDTAALSKLLGRQPTSTFYTSSFVTKQFAGEVPANLISDWEAELCRQWAPKKVVRTSAGGPIVSRTVLKQLLADPTPLKVCDDLHMGLTADGLLKFKPVATGTLAYQLGFRTGDTIQGIDGKMATDPAMLFDALKTAKGARTRVTVLHNDGTKRDILVGFDP